MEMSASRPAEGGENERSVSVFAWENQLSGDGSKFHAPAGLREAEGDRSSIEWIKCEEQVSKEHGLNAKIKVLIEDVELRDEQLTKREKLGNQLLERLKIAQDNVEHLKETVHEKFKQVGLKEFEVKSIRDWVDKKMDELDSKGAELETKEDRLISKEIRLKEKLNEHD